ncbi:MAG: 5'/3'-nucleotidase SurE [Alphaproteobacteria bacterium]|nr:5'/3'-nucleotidase SurE [Alphaproteobacteria bacterium]
MNVFPRELETMRILLTNDDGIDAPGLKAMARIAATLSKDIWVCAPEVQQSGAGHSLTLSDPVRLNRHSKRRFSTNGTPTDCVLLALHRIMKDQPPDLVLSGVNMGGNMGEDITYSGTVAAAMEATLLRVPAIALSLQLRDGARHVHWATAEIHAPDIITKLCRAGWPRGTLININFPGVASEEIAGIEVTAQGQRFIGDNLHERTDPRGRTYFWIGRLQNLSKPKKGTDLAAIEADRISVTPIHLDFTHHRAIKPLREALS